MGDVLDRLFNPEDILFPHEGMANKKNGTDTSTTADLPRPLWDLFDRTAGRQSALQDALWAQMMPGAGAGFTSGNAGGGGNGGGNGGGGNGGGGSYRDGMRELRDVGRRPQLLGPDDPRNTGDEGSPDVIGDWDREPRFPEMPKDRLDVTADPRDNGSTGKDGGSSSGQGRDPRDNGGGGGGGLMSVIDLIRRSGRLDQPRSGGETDAGDGGAGAAPPAGGWIPWQDWTPSADGILGDNSRAIVGSNPLLDDAVSGIYGLTDAPEELGAARGVLDQMRSVSQRQADGAGLEQDPAYLAAMKAFDNAMRPIIENQASLSGLGRSTALTNATASQQAQTLLPLVQDYLGRQERGIDRELGTMGTQFTGLTGLGDRSMERRTQRIAGLTSLGDYGRGIAQDRADSQYNDWLRRAGLFESSLNGPSGLFGSTIGGNTHSDKNGKSE